MVVAALAMTSVTYVAFDKAARSAPAATAQTLAFADIRPILDKHCSGCHAAHPTNPAFTSPPLGVVLDSPDHVRALAPRIKLVAVDAQIMPLGNMTGMTAAERQMLGQWIAKGAPR
jgi:uncharacterized membrane protein